MAALFLSIACFLIFLNLESTNIKLEPGRGGMGNFNILWVSEILPYLLALIQCWIICCFWKKDHISSWPIRRLQTSVTMYQLFLRCQFGLTGHFSSYMSTLDPSSCHLTRTSNFSFAFTVLSTVDGAVERINVLHLESGSPFFLQPLFH